jgi:hypothetical protein
LGIRGKNAYCQFSEFERDQQLPQPGIIACEIMGKRIDAEEREVITIDEKENSWAI